MVDLLKLQTTNQFRKIDEGLAADDLSLAQKQAHSMKSSFGNYGALECQRLAAAMELAGQQGLRDEFIARYERLRDVFGQLIPVLDQLSRD